MGIPGRRHEDSADPKLRGLWPSAGLSILVASLPTAVMVGVVISSRVGLIDPRNPPFEVELPIRVVTPRGLWEVLRVRE